MSGAGGGYINPGSISAPGGSLRTYIEDLTVNTLRVNTSFDLFDRGVDWHEITYVTNLSRSSSPFESIVVSYQTRYVLSTSSRSYSGGFYRLSLPTAAPATPTTGG